jgi:hypothetical protein
MFALKRMLLVASETSGASQGSVTSRICDPITRMVPRPLLSAFGLREGSFIRDIPDRNVDGKRLGEPV